MLNNENSYLFKFAWKSIRRNSGRSFFIGFSVSLAVVIAVWVVAFFDGLNSQIEQSVVDTNIGYYQIQEKNFSKSTESSTPLAFSQYSKLLTSPIISYSPELVLDGNISTPEGSTGLIVIGIHPPLHTKFLPISSNIESGDFLNSNEEGSVVIGKELANLFSFKVGDQLVLNFQDVNGELRSELLPIKGIYHFNSKGFEKHFVYISQKTWQMIYFKKEMKEILFNRIPLMTSGLGNESTIREKFKNTDVNVKTWKNLNPEMAVILEFHDGMIRFFFLIIGITITMTILTPVQMMWQERIKELKMLNILGISDKKFWKVGIFEAFQMIMLSGVFSSIALVIIIGIQSQTGVDFGFLNKGVSIERAGIQLPNIIYPQLTIEQLLITFSFVVFVLAVSYIWSMYRTLKKLEVEI